MGRKDTDDQATSQQKNSSYQPFSVHPSCLRRLGLSRKGKQLKCWSGHFRDDIFSAIQFVLEAISPHFPDDG